MFLRFEFLKEEHLAMTVTEVIIDLYKICEIKMYSCTLKGNFKIF